MAETVSNFMVQRLYEWGVHRICLWLGSRSIRTE